MQNKKKIPHSFCFCLLSAYVASYQIPKWADWISRLVSAVTDWWVPLKILHRFWPTGAVERNGRLLILLREEKSEGWKVETLFVDSLRLDLFTIVVYIIKCERDRKSVV